MQMGAKGRRVKPLINDESPSLQLFVTRVILILTKGKEVMTHLPSSFCLCVGLVFTFPLLLSCYNPLPFIPRSLYLPSR